jgi:type IV pilus assembly protein PilE
MTTRRQNGFTLIEVMIVVAIVGILAAVAYPAYKQSILKGKRAQGRTALAELLQQQERFMTQRNCYLAFTTNATTGAATAVAPASDCGFTTPTTVPFKTFSGDSLTKAAYVLSANACTIGGTALSMKDCVQLVATPKEADSEVGNLRITTTGSKDCTGTVGGTAPTSPLCWP